MLIPLKVEKKVMRQTLASADQRSGKGHTFFVKRVKELSWCERVLAVAQLRGERVHVDFFEQLAGLDHFFWITA
jgi:predicted metal-binding protein